VTSDVFGKQLPQLEKLRRPGPGGGKLVAKELDYALEWIGKLSVGSSGTQLGVFLALDSPHSIASPLIAALFWTVGEEPTGGGGGVQT